MEEDEMIRRRELYGDGEFVTCVLCEQEVARRSAHLVQEARTGVPDAAYQYLCPACYRSIHQAEPIEPETER